MTTVFINIDEDNENEDEVDLNEIFKNQGNEKPFSVEVGQIIYFFLFIISSILALQIVFFLFNTKYNY